MPDNLPVLKLKKGKEKSLKYKHPWVFSGAIAHEPSNLAEGALVKVISADGEYLATGHYHKGTITVRIIDFSNSNIDQDFWNNRITNAWQYRSKLNLTDNSQTNAFRLIHGEGDELPGLIIDWYDGLAVMQTYSAGMSEARPQITAALKHVAGNKLKAVFDKSSDTLAKHAPGSVDDEYLLAPTEELTDAVTENGIRFSIDHEKGQKTGFFLDQRDNRSLLAQYAKDKKVLNTFCYTGGFSLYALKGGAALVHSVDSSKRAMEGTEKNVQLNFPGETRHTGYTEDVMTFLKSTTENYDLIVLDPPAFAKHLNQASNAMIGYRNLNTEGLKRIAKGGILFTFSCSQVIDKTLFRKIIFQSALQAGRTVRIMHQLSQPADHPVSIYHPEAEYLKGLVLFVE